MGSYNSQYESYYSRFSSNRKPYNPYAANPRGKNNSSNFLMKRLLIELIGVFVMLAMVLICKAVVTPQTTAVYNYSKSIVNKNYDYTYLLNTAKSFNISNISDLQQSIENYIENLKIKIGGGVSIKEKVKSDFISPVKGQIAIDDGKNGVEIVTATGSTVAATFDGTVKEAGQSQEFGKYVLINHGSGIESRCCNLSELVVKAGNEVKKGDSIGKSGNSNKAAEPSLHFDLYYMGESVSPTEYIDFKIR